MYFTIPPSSYLIDSDLLGIGSEFCVLGIVGYVPDKVNKFIFGNTFLSNYYSIFDYDNKRIGLALNLKSEGKIKEDPITPPSSYLWLTLIIIFGAMIIVAIIAICIIRRINLRKVKINPNIKIRKPSDELLTSQ